MRAPLPSGTHAVESGSDHHCESRLDLSRRAFLGATGLMFAWSAAPRLARAEGRDPRLLVVVLRGALDGLSVAAPLQDPAYAALRGSIALGADGASPALPLDGFFALHPAMPQLHALYGARDALIVHAVASPYRERSHFDGQDLLESGTEKLGFHESGWLNRALDTLAPGERIAHRPALGVGPLVPLVARGRAPVVAWQPQSLPPAGDDLTGRLIGLYRQTDPALAAILERRSDRDPGRTAATGMRRQAAYVVQALSGAAAFLARPDGPRIGALALDGFDTHANEGGATGQLAGRLAAIDQALGEAKAALGKAWRETVILFVTEFGRTARVNGTDGTDHGTATVALLVGGAVKGGRVVADWPGLAPADLHEGRDLKPTTDLRAVLKGVLRDHLRADPHRLAETVFPGSLAVRPMDGLVG
ncbi:hypothetical protein BN1110_04477 [bacterium YEK0313]|nr:hypothetical protein BN1110_04477 [bacterium YEK0313]